MGKSDKNGNSSEKSRTDNVVDDDVAVTAYYGRELPDKIIYTIPLMLKLRGRGVVL